MRIFINAYSWVLILWSGFQFLVMFSSIANGDPALVTATPAALVIPPYIVLRCLQAIEEYERGKAVEEVVEPPRTVFDDRPKPPAFGDGDMG